MKKKKNYFKIAFPITSATFIPSIAEVVIPPAYPAPSPQGYIPFILDIRLLSLIILTGEELLDSTPST